MGLVAAGVAGAAFGIALAVTNGDDESTSSSGGGQGNSPDAPGSSELVQPPTVDAGRSEPWPGTIPFVAYRFSDGGQVVVYSDGSIGFPDGEGATAWRETPGFHAKPQGSGAEEVTMGNNGTGVVVEWKGSDGQTQFDTLGEVSSFFNNDILDERFHAFDQASGQWLEVNSRGEPIQAAPAPSVRG